jgi:hemolysin activation/secretion protein
MWKNIFTSARYQTLVPIGVLLLSIGNARAANTETIFTESSTLNTTNLVAQVKQSPVENPPSAPTQNEQDPTDRQSPPTENNPNTPTVTSPDKSFLLKKIDVKCGLTEPNSCRIFRPDSPEIRSITQSIEGRSVTLVDIQNIANRITQLYLNRGYITSSGSLPPQNVTDGVVVIRLVEGGVEQIQVEGLKRVNPEYIKSRIRLAELTPLNQEKLEDRLKLLRIDPLFKNVEASLRAGNTLGQSILIVRVTEAASFKGNVGFDNYSPPSVGSEQLGVALAYRNSIASGDQIAASYKRSTTGGANLYDFGYSIPLAATDGTLQLRAAINDYKITDPQFAVFDIRGKSNLYELNYRQPLLRSPREEFALGLGFTYQDGQTFIFNQPLFFGFGPDPNGVSRTSVFKFSQDYVKRDVQGAWSVRSQFNLGTGLFGATVNDGSIPDSRFFSWLGQVQRLQQLNNDNLLVGTLDVQLTPDSLLPSQQFVIGGGQSVRGFRQNARYGDNGVRLSLEDRITLQRNEAGSSVFQVAPFIDAGLVWNQGNNPNNALLPGQNFIAGVGLGVVWEPLPQLNVRVDYGLPLVNLVDKGTNLQDSGLYFSVSYGF